MTDTTPTKMPEIVIDHREMRSPVAKTLERLGVRLTFKTLLVGDYVVSDRIAFERKTMDDLFSSWLDEKKLFEQLYDLAQAYNRPVSIIAGGDTFFTTRSVNVQAIRGMLNAITVRLRVPILYSLTAVETAQHLLLVALKEQNKDGRSISVHGKRSHMNIDEQREYIVSAITDIGPLASRNLLTYFGNVEGVMKASPEELANVKLIGPITAEHIRKVVSGKYAQGGNNGKEKVREDVSIQQGAEELAS